MHRVLSFDQKDWMETYIRLNTELRKSAKSDFEKNFYKLINNSVLYDFYYNFMKAKYGENCQLLYTDTDSLLLN